MLTKTTEINSNAENCCITQKHSLPFTENQAGQSQQLQLAGCDAETAYVRTLPSNTGV